MDSDAEASKDAVDTVCLQLAYAELKQRAISTFVSGAATAFLLGRELPALAWRLVAWLVAVSVLTALRLMFNRWYTRAPHGPEALRMALPTYTALNIVPAILWGSLIAVCGFSTSIWVTSVLLLAIGGMLAAGAATAASTPRVLKTSIVLSIAPLTVHLLVSGDAGLRGVLVLLAGYALAMAAATDRNHVALRRSISLRFENERLLAQLKEEKARELAARESAERANADKSRFVAAASHDVRQPLHAMGLFLESLRGTALPNESRTLVGSIELAHRSLVSLQEGLLEVSVLETGGVTPHLQPVAVSSLFAILENEAAPRAKEKGLELRFVGPEVNVETDPVLMLRVLRNLVSNALRYTERGRVLVTARRRGGALLLQVWDTGLGIPPDQLERVFDELHQVANHERNREAGLGLGLAIVRRLGRAMGFEATVRSKLGRGSVFSLTVPLASDAHRLKVERGALVLLVDDDGLARTAVATLLEQWGYEVVAAQSAEEAAQCLKELERVDAVVSDLWLGGASGLELLGSVQREQPTTRRVLISGDMNPETAQKAAAVGAVFLRKPVRAAALEAALAGTPPELDRDVETPPTSR
ncbi:MAG: hybrid sensor histidine kinase/response regulator [Myxococcaceae bacterium]